MPQIFLKVRILSPPPAFHWYIKFKKSSLLLPPEGKNHRGEDPLKLNHVSPFLDQNLVVYLILYIFLPFFSNFRRWTRTFWGGRNSNVEIGEMGKISKSLNLVENSTIFF